MTDKLQLMLINVLLHQFLNIKVSLGSVATRLRCDGILMISSLHKSLLSPRVNFFGKSVNICRSYNRQLSTGLFFFMKHGVYRIGNGPCMILARLPALLRRIIRVL